MRILLVAGARPNFVKLAPLWRALHQTPSIFEPVILHTGQHYGQYMSQVFFDELQLPQPDICLDVGSASHARQTAMIMIAFERALLEINPDWVVVFGDVNSTAATALVAAKEHYPVAHVEAGLRSFDRAMPEELNRIVTDQVSDLLFTSCHDANENLLREGIDKSRIHFVGNIMIDSLRDSLARTDSSQVLDQLGVAPHEYALVTLHRPSNVDDVSSLRRFVEILGSVARRLPLVFPLHPRTRRNLEALGVLDELSGYVHMTEPFGYVDFLRLEKEARFVMTDSGGMQEETTVLNVPCLTLRDNTERPVTICEGTNRLVGVGRELILQSVDDILSSTPSEPRLPDLWDGATAPRIAKIFQSLATANTLFSPQLRAAV